MDKTQIHILKNEAVEQQCAQLSIDFEKAIAFPF